MTHMFAKLHAAREQGWVFYSNHHTSYVRQPLTIIVMQQVPWQPIWLPCICVIWQCIYTHSCNINNSILDH